jgi:hypothetical protein
VHRDEHKKGAETLRPQASYLTNAAAARPLLKHCSGRAVPTVVGDAGDIPRIKIVEVSSEV